MTRNQHFASSDHEPLRDHPAFERIEAKTTGPVGWLNPTSAHYTHKDVPGRQSHSSMVRDDQGNEEQMASDVQYQWKSRDNRKGRHTLIVEPTSDPSKMRYIVPLSTQTLKATMKGIWRMCTYFPYWDVSWWVAVIFTLGSVVWVINAFFSWLPDVDPNTEFPTETLQGGGITAFLGATIFEIGSVLLMFEAVNENRSGCFGWALEKVLTGEGKSGKLQIKEDIDGCSHHHSNRKNFVGKSDVKSSGPLASSSSSDNEANADSQQKESNDQDGKQTWQWFPSWHDLTAHYCREVGFLACSAQMFGASVFWISGFTALPGINNLMSQGLLDGIYWTPQIIGGSGFIVSGFLFMLETQKHWYEPAFTTLGWWIGLWNLIGAFGFTLCGALGPAYGNSGAEYEAGLATFWGSWAFLIGSLVQWYESLDTHPVEEKKSS